VQKQRVKKQHSRLNSKGAPRRARGERPACEAVAPAHVDHTPTTSFGRWLRQRHSAPHAPACGERQRCGDQAVVLATPSALNLLHHAGFRVAAERLHAGHGRGRGVCSTARRDRGAWCACPPSPCWRPTCNSTIAAQRQCSSRLPASAFVGFFHSFCARHTARAGTLCGCECARAAECRGWILRRTA
jgi:hypothetical protein